MHFFHARMPNLVKYDRVVAEILERLAKNLTTAAAIPAFRLTVTQDNILAGPRRTFPDRYLPPSYRFRMSARHSILRRYTRSTSSPIATSTAHRGRRDTPPPTNHATAFKHRRRLPCLDTLLSPRDFYEFTSKPIPSQTAKDYIPYDQHSFHNATLRLIGRLV